MGTVPDIKFDPIDLDLHADLCVQFALDSTFGTPEKLMGEDGLGGQRYVQRMRDKIYADPSSCVFAWLDGEVVGQINLGRFNNESIGYIHFFYVIPEWRGRGVAKRMSEFTDEWFRQRRFNTAVLSVDLDNQRALRFYIRQGWKDLGPRPDRPDLHNMEKSIQQTVSHIPWAAKRLGVAAIIFDDQGKILMVKHSYGMLNWEIPGGAAENGESISETAVREVFEEAGLVVTAERLTGVYYMPESDSHHFVFLCRSVEQGKEPASVSEETTDCGFFAPGALPRPISDFTVLRIQHALEGGSLALPVNIGPRVWLE